jgi:hypothetical protein
MDTGERRLFNPHDPSELPTKPSIRLPLPSLPQSLPRVPLVAGRADEDGGFRVPTAVGGATGASPGPVGSVFLREVGHGGG